jgi:hypothetical protein
MPRTDEVVVTSFVVPIGPTVPTTLEVSGLGTKNPMGIFGTEILMGVAHSMDGSDPSMLDPAHNAASVNVLPSGSTSTLPALGFPLFLSNLQLFVSHDTSFYQWVFFC